MEQLQMIHKMQNLPEFSIADGYSIRMYQPGDEVVWTKICKFGLLEEHEGIECWKKYMLDMDYLEAERDVFFIDDPDGNTVATCAAFFIPNGEGLMHMLGCLPEARGRKLATTMTAFTLHKLHKEKPDTDFVIRLRTDDWRVSAVRTYLNCGFQPVLFDVDMDTRWKVLCDKLDFHPVEMLDSQGNPTGLIL